MSHFIREFEQLVASKTQLTPNRVWGLAGMDASMLSRIRKGDERQSNIQFEDLNRVAAAIGPEEEIYLRLLRARLLDQCDDKRAARIMIEILGTKISGGPIQSALRNLPLMPAHWETALVNIAQNMKTDAGLRETILWLGNEVFSSESDPTVEALLAKSVKAGVSGAKQSGAQKPKARSNRLRKSPPAAETN